MVCQKLWRGFIFRLGSDNMTARVLVSAVLVNECWVTCPLCLGWNHHTTDMTNWGPRVCDHCGDEYCIEPDKNVVVYTDDQLFRFQQHIQRERKQVLGPPPYTCKNCGKQYQRDGNFKKHVWDCLHSRFSGTLPQ